MMRPVGDCGVPVGTEFSGFFVRKKAGKLRPHWHPSPQLTLEIGLNR